MQKTSLITVGMLNTDIILAGLTNFPKPNDPTYGGKLMISPGGKPGNIARMSAALLPRRAVAIIGKTVRDEYNLWQVPLKACQDAGVNTEYVKILDRNETSLEPSVAVVGVDQSGNNLCFVLPGVAQELSADDVEAATPLFVSAATNNGSLALTLECPLETANKAMLKATELGLRVIFDPGGVTPDVNIESLLKLKPHLLKPNEHEARIITGIEVRDFETARQAAEKLMALGVQNVLITQGAQGAYLFTADQELHIPVPQNITGSIKDPTGCGDQMMAVLCTHLQSGKSVEQTARAAVVAGTLQFYKSGCVPLTGDELEAQL